MAVKPLDLVFFGRPMLVIPVWTVYLHFLAANSRSDYLILYPEPAVIAHLIFLTLVFKGVYVFNQIFDIESDRRNDKLYFLPCGLISLRTAWIYYVILSSAGLVVAFLHSQRTGFLAAVIIVLGTLYSIPGIKLKDRPISGLLANAVAYGLLIPFCITFGYYNSNDGVMAAPYFLAIAAGYILTTIPDCDGDAAIGKKTVAVILGPKGALWLALLTSFATAVASLMTDNVEMAVVSGLTFILVVILVFSFRFNLLMFVCKFPILLLTLLAGIHFPFYLLLLLLTIILTRIYYKKRFGIVYPKLG
jgi:4-hydroxybenzoate polyprenyltransferase